MLIEIEHDLLNKGFERSTSEKLFDSASLLAEGIKDGFVARAISAKDNWSLAAMEVVGAATVGAALVGLDAMGGRYKIASKALGLGLGVAAAADLGVRVGNSAGALHDNWNMPGDRAFNKDVIARNLGAAAFDYPLAMAAGFGGVRLGTQVIDAVVMRQVTGTFNPSPRESELGRNLMEAIRIQNALSRQTTTPAQSLAKFSEATSPRLHDRAVMTSLIEATLMSKDIKAAEKFSWGRSAPEGANILPLKSFTWGKSTAEGWSPGGITKSLVIVPMVPGFTEQKPKSGH